MAPVVDSRSQTLYYQCKSCLSFLTSLSNGESHLERCFQRIGPSELIDHSESSRGDQLSEDSKPDLGFREMAFIQPRLIIKRLTRTEIKADLELRDEDTATGIQTRTAKLKRKSWTALLDDNESESADETNSNLDADWREEPVVSSEGGKRRTGNKKGSKKDSSKKILPRKWICSINEDGSQKRVRSRLYLREKVDVRSFRYPCHLCPAKFFIQQELDAHVNGIHNGNRKLISCCVCLKIFNKRDSLNSHIRGHETAELLKEKYNLLQPWTEERLKDLYLVKKSATRHHVTFMQPKCYFCLLPHSTFHSYITHIRKEHFDPPEAFRFTCTFEECSEYFTSIKDLLDHAKTVHPLKFYGRLTWNRMNNGIYTGKKESVTSSSKIENNADKKHPTPKGSFKVKRKKPSHTLKRKKSFTPKQDSITIDEDHDDTEHDDPDDDDWLSENRKRVRHIPKITERRVDLIPPERKIELERVHICDHTSYEVAEESSYVKKEPTNEDGEIGSFAVAKLELTLGVDEEFDNTSNAIVQNCSEDNNATVLPSVIKIEKDLMFGAR